MTPRVTKSESGTGWPELPLEAWQDTLATLHRILQIVGKVRLALTPRVNHFWNAAFALTPRGYTTGPMPMRAHASPGDRGSIEQPPGMTPMFAVDFDFIDHLVEVRTSDGERRALPLVARPVAAFLSEFF